MNGHRSCALRGQVARDQPAQILGSAGNENGFALDLVVRHEALLLRHGTAPAFPGLSNSAIKLDK
jgi:hypothetical protein